MMAAQSVGLLITAAAGMGMWYLINKRRERKRVDDMLNPYVDQADRDLKIHNLYMKEEKLEAEPTFADVDNLEYSWKSLTIGKILGEGNFGYVVKAKAVNICGNNGTTTVAVKRLKVSETGKEVYKAFNMELKLMKELRPHPNVVRLLGYCTKETKAIIVEFLRYGDLLGFLKESRPYRKQNTDHHHLNENDLMLFMQQIASGMNHLAKCNIIHRDLACRNVLVGYHKICKIADFGLAKKLDKGKVYKPESNESLPRRWMAPESIFLNEWVSRSDVWSFGVVMWEILTIGKKPYARYSLGQIGPLLKNKYRLLKPGHCSDKFFTLVLKCWNDKPNYRPRFHKLESSIKKMNATGNTHINLRSLEQQYYKVIDG